MAFRKVHVEYELEHLEDDVTYRCDLDAEIQTGGDDQPDHLMTFEVARTQPEWPHGEEALIGRLRDDWSTIEDIAFDEWSKGGAE